jgi:hypothetical protein
MVEPVFKMLQAYVVGNPVTLLVQFTAIVLCPLQIVCEVLALVTFAVGITEIVKGVEGPVHELTVAVTEIFATKRAFPAFVALKALIAPVPEAARFIPVCEFVQLKVEPGNEALKLI